MVAFRDLPANIELYPVVVFYSQVSSIHNSSLLIRIMKRLNNQTYVMFAFYKSYRALQMAKDWDSGPLLQVRKEKQIGLII